jgi:hypothetical protein
MELSSDDLKVWKAYFALLQEIANEVGFNEEINL